MPQEPDLAPPPEPAPPPAPTDQASGEGSGPAVPPAPPTATTDRAATAGENVELAVLANDVDPDGDIDPATLVIVEAPLHGEAQVVDGTILYEPAAGFSGLDQLIYRVCDAGGRCDETTVTVRVSRPGAADDDDDTCDPFVPAIPRLQVEPERAGPGSVVTVTVEIEDGDAACVALVGGLRLSMDGAPTGAAFDAPGGRTVRSWSIPETTAPGRHRLGVVAVGAAIPLAEMPLEIAGAGGTRWSMWFALAAVVLGLGTALAGRPRRTATVGRRAPTPVTAAAVDASPPPSRTSDVAADDPRRALRQHPAGGVAVDPQPYPLEGAVAVAPRSERIRAIVIHHTPPELEVSAKEVPAILPYGAVAHVAIDPSGPITLLPDEVVGERDPEPDVLRVVLTGLDGGPREEEQLLRHLAEWLSDRVAPQPELGVHRSGSEIDAGSAGYVGAWELAPLPAHWSGPPPIPLWWNRLDDLLSAARLAGPVTSRRG